MRRYFLFVSILLLTIASSSCNSTSQKGNADNNDSASAEIAKFTDSEQTEKAADAEASTSLDVAFFDLKGNVKKCVLQSDDYKETYLFDKNGAFIDCIEEYAETEGVRRDEQGRINEMHKKDNVGRTWADIYEYDADGRVIKSHCNAMPDGLSHEHNYTYNNGRIVSIKGWNDGPGNLEMKYEYSQEDEMGNWTERKKSLYIEDETEPYVTVEHRTIEYYK